ncbi:esterase/lipase family protein [Persicirhabdus sediminis]|uniref:esterase/lipase family protein n=1 Tax=Persicirhabdus sediminis TaxID=454144 RepID=UPI001F430AAE|nr:alpha/beta hydrolase [Persicirhabdus sediminis]
MVRYLPRQTPITVRREVQVRIHQEMTLSAVAILLYQWFVHPLTVMIANRKFFTRGPQSLLLLAISLFVISCGGLEVSTLTKPIQESQLATFLSHDHHLSDRSRQTLDNNQLLKDYKKSPDHAIHALIELDRKTPSVDNKLCIAEISSRRAELLESEGEHQKALGYYLCAAKYAIITHRKPILPESIENLRNIYNLSCSQATSIIYDLKVADRDNLRIEGPEGIYTISWDRSGKYTIDPTQFDSIKAADYIEIKGMLTERVRRDAVGAAMAGHMKRPAKPSKKDAFMPHTGFVIPATACIQLDEMHHGSQSFQLTLFNSYRKHTINLDGDDLKLSYDFTTALALIKTYSPEEDFGFSGMLNPNKYEQFTGLYLLRDYDPDKIPVVLVHGLMSSPLTWLDAINVIQSDPVLREKYQPVMFFYPTGYPIGYSAAKLRILLDDFQEVYNPNGSNPHMKNMVMIGHSMGGLLTNMQIRESGDDIYNALFERPIEQIDMSQQQKDTIMAIIEFSPNPNIKRVVFAAAPHRGSDIASGKIGDIARWLINIPFDIIEQSVTAFSQMATLDANTSKLTRLAPPSLPLVDGLTPTGVKISSERLDGIASLEPNNPFNLAVLKMPIGKNTTYHSIIGSKNLNDPLAESSDGVVPYWSSHLDGAASEKIVHSGHSLTGKGATIAEIRRILFLHLGQTSYPELPLLEKQIAREAE